MKVRVIKPAFYNGARRHPGQVIKVPDDAKGSWFEVISAPAEVAEAPKPQRQPRAKATPVVEQSAGDLV